ncbi:MAG: peptidoglycan-binding domain-containing protein [Bryobacteraceae bacterium]|nr:peptidoglycan-binding domain-containing protein [Bryobacteraceae bacterium]
MLERGSRGPDVERLQRELNRALGRRIPVTGTFGEQTEQSVREFQRLNDLVEDGRIGPLTHTALFSSNYEFAISRPPVVQQERFTCWAAALESTLRSTWGPGRQQWTVAQLLSRYKRFVQPQGDITAQGFNQAAVDLRTFGLAVSANQFRVEPILAELGRNKSHVILVHDLTGSVAHAVVIYGVRIEQGLPVLLIMDPLAGGYGTQDVSVLRGFASTLMVLATHRISNP